MLRTFFKSTLILALLCIANTASAQGTPSVYQQAALDGQAAQNRGDLKTAFEKFSFACLSGDIYVACNNAGSMAYDGKHVAKDLPLARRLYSRACAAKIAASCEVYGAMLKEGEGGPKDIAGSLGPLKIACDSTYGGACYNAGYIHFAGLMGKGHLASARGFFDMSCDRQYALGCYAAGLAKQKAEGAAVTDLAAAARAFSKACDLGYADGCLNYGIAQISAQGMAEDAAGARSSFARACNAGSLGGCMNAGMMARDGTGGTRDVAAATKYFGNACSPPDIVQNSDDGVLIHVPGVTGGNGAGNADVLVLRTRSGWKKPDMELWFDEVNRLLPGGFEIRSGVDFNFREMHASSPVWRKGDGNCCGTGGTVQIDFVLADDTGLAVERIAFDQMTPVGRTIYIDAKGSDR